MADNIKYRFIQNVGDYFPSDFFSEDFIDKVQKVRGISADEMSDLCRPYGQLRREYDTYKNYIVNSNPRVKDAILHTHQFNDRLLNILGYNPEGEYQFYSIDEEAQTVVPVRLVFSRGGQTSMLVMEMQHLIPVGDRQPSGLFEQRYNVEGDTQLVRHQQYYAGQWSGVFTLPDDCKISPAVINKAIDALFLLPPERRPHYILMMAGNTVFLLSGEKWNRGAYLQFSLDELFSQASISAFRKYYALFHLLVCKDTLASDSETVLMDRLLEESYKSAYEVTKDLKNGVVLAVESLANEALYWWKQNNSVPVEDYTDDTFEAKVKDDCLTIVYRLLFVFYAESRDELDILPTNNEAYNQGYSLEMLRDLEKVPLVSEASRNGFFIDDSLRQLFRLLSTGYHENRPMGDKSFTVTHIDSPLFDDTKLNYLGDVRFRNIVWQTIIQALSLSHRDKQVGRISYANLGVNQLGSVYESLLAYRGFYAEEDYIEVHKAGKPEDGTFLVPYSRMDDFESNEILCDKEERPVVLKQGTFVYRLNGRDRQKSASYYTPEVLTRSTVKYTLKAIIDEVATGKRKASDLLNLKILEPAMGAAAFQNEVINQLAEAYITQREIELKKHVPSTERRNEIQKVKAYIATHNVYGVDLNPTAIELGKLSLWLNVIHKDMETPFFSNRLCLGNAVIGAWLKVYDKSDVCGIANGKNYNDRTLRQNKWWEKAPHRVKFYTTKVNRKASEVYHFLLLDPAMLGVRSIGEQRNAHREQAARMNSHVKDWTAPVTGQDFAVLQRLSQKIDLLLKEYFQFQQSVDGLTQNKMALWGVAGNYQTESFASEKYAEKERLNDVRYRHDNAYFRLKMVMDYWCSLWFWEYDDADSLPTRADYWADIEAMLSVSDEMLNTSTRRVRKNVHIEHDGQLGMFAEGQMNDLFRQAEYETSMASEEPLADGNDADSEIVRLSKEQILTEVQGSRSTLFDNSLRFKIVKRLADRYHFFHPMLEFIEVFWLRDGFDIICGNPPWIKLEFDEVGILSEKYPEVAIRKMSAPDARKKRDELFVSNPDLEKLYRAEEIENVCSGVFLNAYQNYPLLIGQQTNLYKCILTNGFSLMSERGFVGLIHPDTVYDDPDGQPLRREIYQRLRFHFQFVNVLKLFAEILHWTIYGINIYGGKKSEIKFDSISNLFHPGTIETSYISGSSGICGGLKINGNWNIRGHNSRIITYGEKELKILTDNFEDNSEWEVCKLATLHSMELLHVLSTISNFPRRISNYSRIVTRCLEETSSVDDGIIKKNVSFANVEEYEMIFSGPHFFINNPIYKCPKAEYRHHADYNTVDLCAVSEDFCLRTIYKPVKVDSNYKEYINGFECGQNANGEPIFEKWIDYYKFGYRKMLSQTGERTLIGCIMPPKTMHLATINSIVYKSFSDLVETAGLFASLVYDFYVRIIGANDLYEVRLISFPLGIADKYKSALFVRTLMLNCLTKHYADLWEEVWRDDFRSQTWSIDDERLHPFSTLQRDWSWDIPLRNYFERRQALVEIDVIAAMALGLSLQDLEMIYTIQFPVLQQNENDTWYDAEGKIVFTCSKGLTGVGLDRKRNNKTGMLGWEDIRGEQIDENTYAGTSPTHTHTIDPAKSELYGGQQQTFVAPYTRCDRIADYRTAWEHFKKVFEDK